MTRRRRTSAADRLTAAIVLSVACHVGVLLAASRLLVGGSDASGDTRFIVALVGAAGADGRAGADGGALSGNDAGTGAAAAASADAAVAGPQVIAPAADAVTEQAAADAGAPAASRDSGLSPRRAPVRSHATKVGEPHALRHLPPPAVTAAARRDELDVGRDASRPAIGDDAPAARASAPAGSDGSGPAGAPGPGGPGAAGAGTAGPGAGTGGGGAAGAGPDLRAWCLACPVPSYPERARVHGWQGTVDVDLDLGGDGTVMQARVGRSSGVLVLDTAAVAVARRSRFQVPSGGQPSHGQLRYQFLLESRL